MQVTPEGFEQEEGVILLSNKSVKLTVHLPQKSGHNDLTMGGVHEEEYKDLSDRENEETQIQR